MKVTVFGASGRTGRLVVARALDNGHNVTAVLRTPAPPGDRQRLRVVCGDVLDPATTEAAVAGSDAVVSTVAPPLRRHVLRPTDLYSTSGRNLVRAMRDAGVRRLIVVSSAGVLDGDPSHPLLYRLVLKPGLLDRALYRDMRKMEREVASSDLDWTIVRASGLTDGPATGRYRVASGQLPERGHRLSRADLANFLLDHLDGKSEIHSYPTVAY